MSQRAPGSLVGGRYQLVQCLGQGALTQTWQAVHVDLQRAVAIKFLHHAQPPLVERMLDEARVVAQVRHPHVVAYSDFGRTEQGEPFFVMELLAGQTVEQLLASRGVVSWARVVAIVQQVADALGAAHQQGIVHRDLRPGNVFLVEFTGDSVGSAGDFVKVVDWGLARGTAIGGTPGYMSPEQCRGEPLDPRSDVYAIGCLLYTMVTGDPPFVGDAQQVIWQQINESPKRLCERAPRQFIPDELEAIVARCLAKHPAQRFANTHELAASLAHLAQFSRDRVAAPVVDPSASQSKPMGFAGRPAPKSPRELTDSYAPIRQPIVDDRGPRPAPSSPASGMSTPVVVAATLAGVVAVVGFGVGMYWLVSNLINPPSAAPDTAATQASVPTGSSGSSTGSGSSTSSASAKSIPTQSGSAAPARSGSMSDPAPEPEPEPEPEPGSSAGSNPADAPSPANRSSAKKSTADKAGTKPTPSSEPVPPSEPESASDPKPVPKPSKPKPTIEPDSKASDKIGHDELLDPWG